jgi:hypothetical protein
MFLFISALCVKGFHRKWENALLMVNLPLIIQGVSAKTFEPNNSVIFHRIFVKFKMQIF